MKQMELIEKRKPREKHYLQEDGTIIATIYDDDVHYLKNGKYEEIDNELIMNGEYYVNKSNSYKVAFKENVQSDLMKMESGSYFIDIKLKDENKTLLSRSNNPILKGKKIKYKELINSIDIEYKLFPTKVKEKIIIKDNNNIPSEISFLLFTNLNLTLNSDRSISAINDNKNIFTIEAPYMLDSNDNYNDKICYKLIKNDDNYELKLLLDVDWLKDSKTLYPVTIDPTITNDQQNSSIIDTYIYNGDDDTSNGNTDILKAGVERINGTDRINRALIRFDLPKIGTGSQIINAKLKLMGYIAPYGTYDSDIVSVHRITNDWNETSAKWSTMYDKFDSKVETVFRSNRSFLLGDNSITLRENYADITNLVKRWYTDLPNYGLLLKQSNEVYNTEYYPAFISNNISISGGNPKPVLIVTYRNQNGYEPYMKYIPQMFNIGGTYVNTYNGNLCGNFNLISTRQGKFPVGLSLIYNTNDVVLGSNLGYGLGYRLNLHQTVEVEDSSCLKYTDEDGTIHYYYDEKTIHNISGSVETVQESNTFFDEDGLGTKIINENNKYVLIDNDGNKMEFAKNGNIALLTKIIDESEEEISITYIDNRISKITDANNYEINLTYATNRITITNVNQTVYLNYNNSKLTSITNNLGNMVFVSNSNGIITQITNLDGKIIKYYYYDEEPYRLRKIEEIGLNNSRGGTLELFYNYGTTTTIDNLGRATTMSFNNYGNVVSTTNLKNNTFVSDAVGKIDYYGENFQEKNKIVSTGIPTTHVNNYLQNTSFEGKNVFFHCDDSVTAITNSTYHVSGAACLEINNSVANKGISQNISIPKGYNYTFSTYIKNNNTVKLILSYTNSNNEIVTSESKLIIPTIDFERHDVTIYYPEDAATDLTIRIDLVTLGTVYIDDVQLEKGEVANHYNLVENCDFSNEFSNWNCSATRIVDEEVINLSNKFEIVSLDDGTKALKIKMAPTYNTSISQTFNYNGVAGDNYTISFWYKNEGITTLSDETYNSVVMTFEYLHPQDFTPSFQLNRCDGEWQFFSYTFYAEHDYNSITFSIFQGFNANDLYITNVSLFKNIKELNYSYDVNGNITGIHNLTEQETQFMYNYNKQLSRITNSTNDHYSFEYNKNTKKRIIAGTTAGGICNTVKYDNNNNVVQNKIINKGLFQSDNNSAYTLRFTGTNIYFKIVNNTVVLIEHDYNPDRWVIESLVINDITYYRIRHAIINKYLTTSGENIILSNNTDDSTLFSIIETAEKSYKMQSKLTEKFVSNDSLSLKVTNLQEGEKESNFNIFIENTNYKLFTEDNSLYDNNGKYITKTTDSLLNSTFYQVNSQTGLNEITTNAKGQNVNYNYDNVNRLVSVNYEDRVISYDYNNDLLSKISFDGKNYNFNYDDFLNLKSININGNTNLFTNTYASSNGPLIGQTYGNGNQISMEYDDFDRIKKVTKMSDTYNYKYDNNGNLAKIISNNDTIKYLYDYSKRLKEFSINDFEVKYQYERNYINKTNLRLLNYEKSIQNNYDASGSLTSTLIDNNNQVSYSYDNLGRLSNRTINNNISTTYEYACNGNRSSSIINKIHINNENYSYKYDKLYNITHVYKNGILLNKYYYNKYNELIREDNYLTNITTRYKYNLSGNILSKKSFKINTFELINDHKFTYNNQNWNDQLTMFDGKTIQYDSIGNPIKIGNNITLTWENGRELISYTDTTNTINYKYNVDGCRTQKNVNNVTTNYYLENSNVLLEKTGNNVLYFIRDAHNELIGFMYNDDLYYYKKNIHNDIIGIYNSDSILVATYSYDSWGNIEAITDGNGNDVSSNLSHIANINPYRYASYYYDKETQLYYLNTRYYNPKWCRFINIDIGLPAIGEINGYNMYAYSCNNPICFIDSDGKLPKWAKKALKVVAIVAVTAVVVAAVVAAAPAVAGAVKAGAIYYGTTIAAAKTLSTVATVACVAVAASTVAVGTNRVIETITGTNYGQKVMGEDNYNNFEACVITTAMIITSVPQYTGYPSTGDSEPQNLQEQMAINAATENPTAGIPMSKLPLNDTRFPHWLGWQKYEQISDGYRNVHIHYVGNKFIKFFFDFKIKR